MLVIKLLPANQFSSCVDGLSSVEGPTALTVLSTHLRPVGYPLAKLLVKKVLPTSQFCSCVEGLSSVEGPTALAVLSTQLLPVGEPLAKLLVQAHHTPVSHEHREEKESLQHRVGTEN